ncbi:hypothetical protein QF037_009506 [Streptomyces canus]|nr:hypothetical protein [Streptomyces canus]
MFVEPARILLTLTPLIISSVCLGAAWFAAGGRR